MKKTLVFCLVSLIIGISNASEYIPNTILLERNGDKAQMRMANVLLPIMHCVHEQTTKTTSINANVCWQDAVR